MQENNQYKGAVEAVPLLIVALSLPGFGDYDTTGDLCLEG